MFPVPINGMIQEQSFSMIHRTESIIEESHLKESRFKIVFHVHSVGFLFILAQHSGCMYTI